MVGYNHVLQRHRWVKLLIAAILFFPVVIIMVVETVLQSIIFLAAQLASNFRRIFKVYRNL